MDLTKIPTDDLIALRNGNLGKVSTQTLMMLRDAQTADQQAKAQQFYGKPMQETGIVERFGAGLKSSLDQAAMGLRNSVPDFVSRIGDRIDASLGDKRTLPQIAALSDAAMAQGGDSAQVGKVVGDIGLGVAGGAAGTAAVARNAAKLPGIVSNALGNAGAAAVMSPEDKLQNAALAGGLSGAFEGAAKLAGKVGGGVLATSKATPEAQMLIDEGIAVAPWKASDSQTYRAMAERMRASPMTSRVVKNAEARGFEGFNRALVSKFTPPDLILDAGQVVGVKATTTPVKSIGQEGVSELKGRFNLAYDKIYRGKTIPIDDVYMAQVDDLVKATSAYYPEEAPALNGLIKKYQDKLFAGVKDSPLVDASGNKIVTAGREGVNANALKEAISSLQTEITNAYRAGKNQLADLLTDYSTELEMLRVRGLPPGSSDALKQVNERYAGFLQYQKAMSGVGANKAGMITPSQMVTAIKASDRSKNKAAFAQGKAPNQQFALLADRVLGSELPVVGPGTAEKLLGVAALTSPLTLGADYLGALALGTRTGQGFLMGQLPGQAKIRAMSPYLSNANRAAVPMSLLYGD